MIFFKLMITFIKALTAVLPTNIITFRLAKLKSFFHPVRNLTNVIPSISNLVKVSNGVTKGADNVK